MNNEDISYSGQRDKQPLQYSNKVYVSVQIKIYAVHSNDIPFQPIRLK